MGRGAAPDASRARGAPALTAFLDTNIVIRHLTGDPPDMARRATAALPAGEPLLLTDLVLAECVYAWSRPARSSAAELMRVRDRPAVDRDGRRRPPAARPRGLRDDRLDFAEAYLVAQAEGTGVKEILSFDRSPNRLLGINRREP